MINEMLHALDHDTECKPESIDVEIRPLVMKLNQLKNVWTLFSCAGYGAKSDGTQHKRSELGSAYIYLAYDEVGDVEFQLHRRLSRVIDQIDVTEVGYTFRPWRADRFGGEFVPQHPRLYRLHFENRRHLIFDKCFYEEKLAHVKRGWKLFEEAVDEALACESSSSGPTSPDATARALP